MKLRPSGSPSKWFRGTREYTKDSPSLGSDWLVVRLTAKVVKAHFRFQGWRHDVRLVGHSSPTFWPELRLHVRTIMVHRPLVRRGNCLDDLALSYADFSGPPESQDRFADLNPSFRLESI